MWQRIKELFCRHRNIKARYGYVFISAHSTETRHCFKYDYCTTCGRPMEQKNIGSAVYYVPLIEK